MSEPATHILAPMLKKLQQWRPLEPEDQAAVLALPFRVLKFRPHEYLVRQGDTPQNSCLMLSGFSFRHKVAGNGGMGLAPDRSGEARASYSADYPRRGKSSPLLALPHKVEPLPPKPGAPGRSGALARRKSRP